MDWLLGTSDLYNVAYQNPIAARCVDKIGQALAGLPIEVYQAGNGDPKPVEKHPLLDIFNRRSNDEDSGAQVKYVMGALMASYAQMYVRGVRITSGISEIEVVGPAGWTVMRDKMTGELQGYKYQSANRGEIPFVKEANGWCAVRRVIRRRANDRDKAASPVEMAGRDIEENNEIRTYSKGLFKRFGRRPGMLTYPADASITKEQAAEVKGRFRDHFDEDKTGALPMVLGAGALYNELGASASDMQALDVRNTTARETCFVMGVPPVLLGIAGDSTYNNQAEANAAFYRDTIRPLGNLIAAELTSWLQPVYPGLELRFNYSSDAASQYDEGLRWDRVGKLKGIATVDEQRELVGYGKVKDIVDDGDGSVIFVTGADVPLSEAVTPVMTDTSAPL
jgi:HK97 family phage portal protein